MSDMTKEELTKLYLALYYQLNERITFIQPKDKIVAQLLFDLGNIEFLLGNYSEAVDDYRKARSYGFSSTLLKERIKHLTSNPQVHCLKLYKSHQKSIISVLS